jgi:DnaJ-class molecular chaperone
MADRPCPDCGGMGTVTQIDHTGYLAVTCETCDGEGVVEATCEVCGQVLRDDGFCVSCGELTDAIENQLRFTMEMEAKRRAA